MYIWIIFLVIMPLPFEEDFQFFYFKMLRLQNHPSTRAYRVK